MGAFVLSCDGYSRDSSMVISHGTGFYINEIGDVLTNRHVVENCTDGGIYFVDYNSQIYPAEIIAKSDSYDIAALRTSTTQQYYGSLATHPNSLYPVIIDTEFDIFTFGYSKSIREQVWANGLTTANRFHNVKPYIGEATLNISHGSSGSALLDRSALVLGIVFGGVAGEDKYIEGEPLVSEQTIFYHNLNAIVHFAISNNIQIRHSPREYQYSPTFVMTHANRITGMILCFQ